mgnify:CR=1 FL=1
MVFSSLTFIFYFLPLCLILYFITPRKFKKLRNIILLIFSLVFYAWGEPKYIILMLLTVTVSYFSGLLINYFDEKKNKKLKRLTLIVSIVLIIGSLIFFKYTNFIIDNINSIFNSNIEIKNIVLPIGISFYTFQILSYVIDLYWKNIKVQKSWFNLSLYVSFFPQLIAGPIVRYETIEDQLDHRQESLEKVVSGTERFLIGLAKKVLIANQMAILADAVFDNSALAGLSYPVIILGILAYTFQIYFDFSGYSDMAIGLGRIFGFEFLENFNYPYISKSITDFWKRWHISLTTFFREYLYIPLGGNRVSTKRWILNMLIVWFLTGLWHGAAWNFILWGLYFFVILILEKTVLKKIINKTPYLVGFAITFILINIGWVLFRVNNLSDIALLLNSSSTITLNNLIASNPDIILSLVLLPFAFFFSLNIMKKLDDKLIGKRWYGIIKKLVLLGLFVVCISFLVSSMYNPFIYFRF